MKSNWKSKPTPGSDGEFYTIIYSEPEGRAIARHVRPADAERILTLHEDLNTALSLLGELMSYDCWRIYPEGVRTRAEEFIRPYDQGEKCVETQKLFYGRIPGEEDASKAYLVKGMLGGMPFDGYGKPYAFSEKEAEYLRDMGFEIEEAK